MRIFQIFRISPFFFFRWLYEYCRAWIMDSWALLYRVWRTPWCPFVILNIFLCLRRLVTPDLTLVNFGFLFQTSYLIVRQQFIQPWNVVLTYGQRWAIHSLNFFRLLSSQMTSKPLHSQKFASPGLFKPTGSTFMCFKFWHFVFPSVQFDALRQGLAKE